MGIKVESAPYVPSAASLTPVLDTIYAPAASAATKAAKAIRVAGTITINSAAWTNLDTGLDLVLTAVAGQWVEVGVGVVPNGEATEMYLDAVSLVAGAPVANWSKGAAEDVAFDGFPGWMMRSGNQDEKSGSVIRPVTNADLVAGVLTIRFRVREAVAINRTINASGNVPLIVWAINHG